MRGFCFGPYNSVKYGASQYGLRYVDKDELITAVHEGGHAVMALWSGIPVTSVTIRQSGDLLGECCYAEHPRPGPALEERRVWAYRTLLLMLGGEHAERQLDSAIRWGAHASTADRRDIDEAREIAEFEDWNAIVANAERVTARTLREYNNELDAIASGLMVLKTLDPAGLRKLAPKLHERLDEFRAMTREPRDSPLLRHWMGKIQADNREIEARQRWEQNQRSHVY